MTDRLSATLIALADPTRRAILARLATGTATVNELAEPFDMTVQAVSKHIKMLERGGLVLRTRDAQSRPGSDLFSFTFIIAFAAESCLHLARSHFLC